jgi:DNA replication protein DnaC
MASAGSGRKGRATQYDFNFTPGAPHKQIMELASLAFVERAENVVLNHHLRNSSPRQLGRCNS